MPAAVELDLRELSEAIKRAERAGFDLRPAWRQLRKPLRQDQRDHMKEQQGPRGNWPGLARATIEKRMRVGGRAGKFTKRGKLRKSAQRKLDRVLSKRLISGAKIKVERAEMSITSKVKWSGVHQEGGRVGRGARVPARPFMFISDTLGIQAAEVLAKHLTAAFENRKIAR